jgi:ATP-dependent helicase Lhr and Lhr-like helicase
VLSMIGRESLPAGMADDMLLEEAESLAAAAMRPDPIDEQAQAE